LGNWSKLGIPVIAVIILFNFGNYNFAYPLTPPPLDRELTDVEKKCLSEGWDTFRIGKVLSPKMQIFCGTSLENVTCNEGLVLIIKHNGSPACVKPETAVKLEERGWGGMPPPCCKDTDGIHSFEECAAAGNPVMESYPRQCRTADGKHFVEIIPGKEQCEIAGGLWGIWSNRSPATASCNPSTSDVGKECTDSSQCQSFCQANEGAEINSEEAGTCYGYELATCMQEVRNGVVDPEWCQ